MFRYPLRRSSAILLAVAVTLGGAAVAGAATVQQVQNTRTMDGNRNSETAGCPTGSEVSGGGFEYDPHSRPSTYATYPKSARVWKVVAQSPVADDDLISYAVCLTNGGPLVRRTESATLSGPLPKRTTAKCPRGTEVVGGGAETDPSWASVVGSHPKGDRSWVATADAGARGIKVIAHAICAKRGDVFTTSSSVTLTPGILYDATAECPVGTLMTGGGGKVSDPDLDRINDSYPTGAGLWTVYAGRPNFASGNSAVVTYARCLG